jgi:hypothetical protein
VGGTAVPGEFYTTPNRWIVGSSRAGLGHHRRAGPLGAARRHPTLRFGRQDPPKFTRLPPAALNQQSGLSDRLRKAGTPRAAVDLNAESALILVQQFGADFSIQKGRPSRNALGNEKLQVPTTDNKV